MSVNICSVENGSPAHRVGIRAGDVLISVNSRTIEDVLDYRFYMPDKKLKIVVARDGKELAFTLKKGEYEETGMEFETYLMDKQHSCKNGCIFCFVDQLPKGMRKSLYFKDDDSRLSFLFGNYITLTNLTDREVERIIEMHISPVNISVHTTDPELRVKMMKNKNAGESLKIMDRFADAGIKMNCQLVLCRGINDGEYLKKSLADLGRLFPAVSSIAAVPVGLSDHREGLYPLEPYDKDSSRQVLEIIDEFADGFKAKNGTRLAFVSDEFYLKAGREIPDAPFYEDFSQLENGVGMLALLWDEFCFALEDEKEREINRTVSVACGEASFGMLCKIARTAENKFKGLKVNVYPIRNDFFGKNITVSGLVTGTDLIKQLKEKILGEELLLPSCMLRSEGDMFLDDVTPQYVEKQLGVKITFSQNDGENLLDLLTGKQKNV